MAIEEIRSFVRVTDRLATAGQPTDTQLADLARERFDLVVNLGLLDPRYCLADEAGAVRDLGLEYVHIPVSFQEPRFEDLEAFFRAMDASTGRKVFVHCAANYRVSCFVALYGEARLGWSRSDADAHIRRLWEPNAVWAEFNEGARKRLGL